MDINQMQQGGGNVPQTPTEGKVPMSAEHRQELLGMIGQIKDKLGSLSAIRFASKNKTDQLRKNVLKQVFEKLQMAGIDLTDQQSVADFLNKLRQENPELAEMFEQSMNKLLGEEADNAPNVPQDPNAMLDLGVPSQE